jgi:hypothetical protein
MAYGNILADVVQSSTTGTAPVFYDGTGTQTGTLCRAWVNFDGTGGASIRASLNVSSVTRTAAGQYTVNFSTAFANANYAAVGNADYDGVTFGAYAKNFTTSSFIIQCINPALTVYSDKAYVCYSVFR